MNNGEPIFRTPLKEAGEIRSYFFAINYKKEEFIMGFFSSAISTLGTMVTAIGGGLGVWGVVNLLEGYGSDNPGAKSQGIKQLMAGAGIMLIGTTLIPQLSTLF